MTAAGSDQAGLDDSGQRASDEETSGDANAAVQAPADPSAPQDPSATGALVFPANVMASGAPAPATTVNSQTVPRLAAGIVANVKAKATHFDLSLDPAGLGRVDISVHIGADGALNASLNFNSPQAAEALKAHAGELREALQQAGFTLTDSGLSFTAGGSGQGGGQGQGQPSHGPSYTASNSSAAEPQNQPTPAAEAASSPADGLDIRI